MIDIDATRGHLAVYAGDDARPVARDQASHQAGVARLRAQINRPSEED